MTTRRNEIAELTLKFALTHPVIGLDLDQIRSSLSANLPSTHNLKPFYVVPGAGGDKDSDLDTAMT